LLRLSPCAACALSHWPRLCSLSRPAVGEPYPDDPPFYDHRDLPPSLSPWCLSNPNSKGNSPAVIARVRCSCVCVCGACVVVPVCGWLMHYWWWLVGVCRVVCAMAAAKHRMWPGLYGRLDYQGYFQTALTEV